MELPMRISESLESLDTEKNFSSHIAQNNSDRNTSSREQSAQGGGNNTERDQRKGETSVRRGIDTFRSLVQSAHGGDDTAKNALSLALTDLTYTELSVDPEKQKAFDELLDALATWSEPPDVLVVETGDIYSSSTPNALPKGVAGAFVPGKNNVPGTILIARSSVRSGESDAVALEELGEAIGEMAEASGVELADGDVGARLQAVADDDVETCLDDSMFTASSSDTVQIRFGDELVTAQARTLSSVPTLTPTQKTEALLQVALEKDLIAPGQKTIKRSALLQIIELPPGTKLPSALFAVYARSSNNAPTGTGAASNFIGQDGLAKMFEHGVLSTAPDGSGSVFVDIARIEPKTMARGLLDDAFINPQPSSASPHTLNSMELYTNLQNMTGNWGNRKEIRPDIFNLPTLSQLDEVISKYDSNGDGELGLVELQTLFEEGGISIQTAAAPDGTYYVKVAVGGRVGNPNSTVPVVHPQNEARPEPEVLHNIPPGTTPEVESFTRKHGTASLKLNPNNPGKSYVLTEKLMDPSVIDWNGRKPSEAFFSIYQKDGESDFVTASELQDMVDDGVLSFAGDGSVHGNMENVDFGRLGTAVVDWSTKYEELYLAHDPEFARSFPKEGVTNYFMAEKALGVLLRTNGKPIEVPSLYELFFDNGEDLGQGPVRYLDAGGVADLFRSDTLEIELVPTGRGQSSIIVDYGPAQGKNNVRLEDIFGPPPAAGSPPSDFYDYEKLNARELSEAMGISLPQARIIVSLYGVVPQGSDQGTFLTNETVTDLLQPSQVLAPEPMKLGPVLSKSGGSWSVNWDNIGGDAISASLARMYPGQASLQSLEIIDGLETLFGETVIDPDQLQIVIDRTGTRELSLAELGYLFDRDAIKLEPGPDGQSVTAVLDTEKNLVGSDPDTASAGLIAGDDDVDSIFQWDANGSGDLSLTEMRQMFKDIGATPTTGLPVTEENLLIAAHIYASIGSPEIKTKGRRVGFITTPATYAFSRSDIQTMLSDGTLRKGKATRNIGATTGAVLDLTKLPTDRIAEAAFDGDTEVTVDAFLDAVIEITGDVNPLKDGKVREWFHSVIGEPKAGGQVVSLDQAKKVLRAGAITFVPHADGSHIRTLPNPAGLLLFNAAGVFEAIAGDEGQIDREELTSFLVDFLDVPKSKTIDGQTVNYPRKIATFVTSELNTDNNFLALNKSEFLSFVEAAKTQDHGDNTVTFDLETALSNLSLDEIPVSEGPGANFDTEGYTFNSETAYWENDISGASLDNDGFLIDADAGKHIRGDDGLRISVEAPTGPVEADPDPRPPANFNTTGYTLDSATGYWISDATGEMIDHDGFLVDPDTGKFVLGTKTQPISIEPALVFTSGSRQPVRTVNIDTTGYTYDPETGFWTNEATGLTVDKDGYGINPRTGDYYRSLGSGNRLPPRETPLGPVEPEATTLDETGVNTEAAAAPTADAAEFTPFDGADGTKFVEGVTIATPENALNAQLESGEGSVSEQAIAAIFKRYKSARPGSIERKHYIVMIVDNMRQRGMTAAQIGNTLTSNDFSGERLFQDVFDESVYQQLKEDVESDATHQEAFVIEYRNEVDAIFAENFGIDNNGKLVEDGMSSRPTTFTNLLKAVADKVLTLPDTYLADAPTQQQADLLESFSLMNSFFAGSEDALLIKVATKVEGMAVEAGASLPSVPNEESAIDVDLDDLTDDQIEALNVAGLFVLDRLADSSYIGSAAIGTRRIARFISLMVTRQDDLLDLLKFISGKNPSAKFSATLKAFGFKAGEFDQARTEFKTHGLGTAAAATIGVIGLAIRYGESDSNSLELLKDGDPRHIISFLTQIGYVSGYILQAAPDNIINLRIARGKESYGASDIENILEAIEFTKHEADNTWQSVVSSVPSQEVSIDANTFTDPDEIAANFGLATHSDDVLKDAGLTRSGAIENIQEWAKTVDGKKFIQNYGEASGAFQAIFISAVGGDDTYIHSFEANYLLRAIVDADAPIDEDKLFLPVFVGHISDTGAVTVDPGDDEIIKLSTEDDEIIQITQSNDNETQILRNSGEGEIRVIPPVGGEASFASDNSPEINIKVDLNGKITIASDGNVEVSRTLSRGSIPTLPRGRNLNLGKTATETLNSMDSPEDLTKYLQSWGMSKKAAESVVFELILLNNWHYQQIPSAPSDGSEVHPGVARHYRNNFIKNTGEMIQGTNVRTSARHNLLELLWSVGNDNGLFDATDIMLVPTSIGAAATTNAYGATVSGITDSGIPLNINTAYAPDMGDAFPSLNTTTAPSYVKNTKSGTVSKAFKGLKIVGQYAEWGGDVFGAVGSAMDLATAIRNDDNYDKGAASLGIANSIFNLAAIIVAGSGGTLTIAVSVLAGLTGVAQILMGLVKPPASAASQFAQNFIADFDDFPEIFLPSAEKKLDQWYETSKNNEFAAWAEEQDIDDENFY